MSPKNKKTNSKRKYNRIKKNAENKEEAPQSQFSDTEYDVGNKEPAQQKMELLNIIEKTTNQLKSDPNNLLLALLEDLLSITEDSSEQKNMKFQLVNTFFTYLLDCDDEEIHCLKSKIKSKFVPKELKKLVVADDAIILKSKSILGTANFGILIEGFLKKSDGSRIRVVVKEPFDWKFNKEILHEAKVLCQFDHDNIMKVLAFHKGGPKFAVEFVQGNLCDVLMDNNFSQSELLDILRQVASGMQYIAEKKYVHRDLRCSNVMLDSRGKWKISEFSLCQYVGDTEGVYEEQDLNVECLYLSPETQRTNKFTTKSDVWAMGLLVWETYFKASGNSNDSLIKEHAKLYYLRIFVNMGKIPCPQRSPPFLWMYVRNALLCEDPEARPTFTEIKGQLDQYDLF